ncbi:MAG: phosphate ABC transporter permease subunit PstC [Thermomicrobiales bacterium]
MAKTVTSTADTGRIRENVGFRTRPLTGSSEGRIVERLVRGFLFLCATVSVATTAGIVFVLIFETMSFFEKVSPWEFYTGTTWTALFNNAEYGVLPLVAGTLVVSIIALIVALPVGLAAAIYLSMYAPRRLRSVVKPALEVLAGIPTVVFGYFALTFVTPQIVQRIFPDANVFNALSAGLTVGFLIIPLVSSLSEDALQAVPRDLRDGAFALGATKFEVATRVMVPAAFSGIVASVILAFSRAIGETMIVVLASGGIPNWTIDARESMQTMTAYIVQISSGDVARGTTKYETLFAVGFTLFLMTLVLNIASHFLVQKFREVYE